MLNFTARNIAKIERENQVNFFEMIQNLQNASNLALLLQMGGKLEDDAFDMIDEKGFDGVSIEIMEGLSEAGFLPLQARIELKKSLPAMKKEYEKLSGESGKKTK